MRNLRNIYFSPQTGEKIGECSKAFASIFIALQE